MFPKSVVLLSNYAPRSTLSVTEKIVGVVHLSIRENLDVAYNRGMGIENENGNEILICQENVPMHCPYFARHNVLK